MRRLIILMPLCFIACSEADKAKENAEPIDGIWRVVYVSREGKEIPEAERKQMRFYFKDGEMLAELGPKDKSSNSSGFKLDPSQSPKAIDLFVMEAHGPDQLGIYELDGKQLKLYLQDREKKRPKGFPEGNRTGKGAALVILEKVSDKVDKPIHNRIAADARTIVDNADAIELYSLQPDLRKKVKDGFHGWKVLGKTTIKEEKERRKLLAALHQGVKENRGVAAACFNPRHGIRGTHDGKTVDLVICFECLTLQVYGPGDVKSHENVSESPRKTFIAMLKTASVPLAK